MHDVCGIVCLLVYVVFPLVLLVNFLLKKQKQSIKISTSKNAKNHNGSFINIAVLIAMGLLGFLVQNKIPTPPVVTLSGHQKTVLPSNVVKLENKNALIYVKKMDGFYSAEHGPMNCWEGSGYSFESVQTKEYNGIKIHSGTLRKGDEKLYAAWWFDDGTLKTIEQWQWRWSSFSQGSQFSLVNVNCENSFMLNQYIDKLLTQNIFKK